MKNKIYSLLITFLITGNAGWCAARPSDIAVKFILAMAGVVISSVVIFLGLSIYNKIIVKGNTQSASSAEDEVLKTPKTVDDAIKFFINRNRLR